MLDATNLPDDVAALKAMLIAATAREADTVAQIARKDERIERLEKLVAAFKQAAFGRKSEKTDPDQLDLALEDLETAMAAIHAEEEADSSARNRVNRPRATNRGSLPQHLPRVEEIIEPESLICACGGCLHCIGEDVLDRGRIARSTSGGSPRWATGTICPTDCRDADLARPSPDPCRTKSPLGEALAYIAKYWDGLKLFLTDGRIEIDNNSVERTIRPRMHCLPDMTPEPRIGQPLPRSSRPASSTLSIRLHI